MRKQEAGKGTESSGKVLSPIQLFIRVIIIIINNNNNHYSSAATATQEQIF